MLGIVKNKPKYIPTMQIHLERIYTPPTHQGYRLLADRLWPRGVSKQNAHLDEWRKDLGPSTKLRQWFSHDPAKMDEFCALYLKELQANPTPAHEVLANAKGRPLILLTASKNIQISHLIPLQSFLKSLMP